MTLEEMKISEYADNVKSLSDYPSDAGITAEQLKAVFDGRGDKEIKNAINAIIELLISNEAAGQIKTSDGNSIEAKLSQYAQNIGELCGDVNELKVDVTEKVSKEDGKCLSTNDFTDEEKSNLKEAFEHISDTNNPHKIFATQIFTTLEDSVDDVLSAHAQAIYDLQLDLGDIDSALDSILALEDYYIGGGAQ